MSEKKYSIVRVDGKCPSWCGDSRKLDYIVCDLKAESCSDKCKYGDTKEQFVAKVNQALKMSYEERTGNYGCSLKFYEPIARKIVEFLGVI